MRLLRSWGAGLRSRLPLFGAVLVVVVTACGGGGAAGQPTPAGSPTSGALPTPARPTLASPVPSPSPSAPAAAEQTYVVQPGDTLLSIAQQFYGDGTKWRAIYDANRDVIGDNPDALKVDVRLRIPPRAP